MNNGKLIFEYAVMNTGKSTRLLQINHNYNQIKKKTLLIKPSLDTRDVSITSRLGPTADCSVISPTELTSDLLTDDINAILVDEAQFLTKEQVLDLRKIADERNVEILCFGLRTNFKGELFEGSNYLFARADKLIEGKTLCHCGKKATMVLKFDTDGKVIKNGDEIDCGAEDKYISVCHKHWSSEVLS